MLLNGSGEVCIGKKRCVQCSVGSLEVIIGSILVNQLRLTPGHLIGQLRVGKGYLMVTVCQQG